MAGGRSRNRPTGSASARTSAREVIPAVRSLPHRPATSRQLRAMDGNLAGCPAAGSHPGFLGWADDDGQHGHAAAAGHFLHQLLPGRRGMGLLDRLDAGGGRLPHGDPGLGLRRGQQLHRLHGPWRQRVRRGHRRPLTALPGLAVRADGVAGGVAVRAGPARPQTADRARGRGAHRGAARDDHLRRSRRRARRAHRTRAAPHQGGAGPGRPRAPRRQPLVSGRGAHRVRRRARAVLAATADRGRRKGRTPAAGRGPALPSGGAGRHAPGSREHPAPRGTRVRARP